MKNLLLPDLPVRWDPQLVEKLADYRNVPQENAKIRHWIKRSGRYEAMIRSKLQEAGLPEDLLYVAMVESGFDPSAGSEAGAVGLWQFIESTGREHGLVIDRWADQRLSPEHATDAALAFLSTLHDRLGSWPLVLAAYNMGHAGLQRAMRKYNTNDFWVLAQLEAGLPYETITYVANVTACAIVARNTDAFRLTGLIKDADVGHTLVAVPGGTSLGRLSRAAGMRVSELADLNPELHQPRLPPDILMWELRIPREVAPEFERRWNSFQPIRPAHRTHRLRLGERLEDVAAAYETTVPRLRALNGLTAEAAVRHGQELTVPDVEPLPVEPETRVNVGVPDATFHYPDRKRVFYRALDGDRVEDVARAFGVTPAEIARWNDLTSEANLIGGLYLQLFVPKSRALGDVIVLSPDQVKIHVIGTEEFYDSYEARQSRRRIRYRVQPGDTLATLAERFGISAGSIARINRFSRYEDPEPNRELILYVDEEAAD